MCPVFGLFAASTNTGLTHELGVQAIIVDGDAITNDAMPVNMTIYIVDDEAAIRHSLSLILKESGYSVMSFPSAEVFLEEADSRLQGIMLLDQSMPGMTGVELQAELTRRGIVLPIIFMTGHGDERIHVEVVKAGAINVLEKPFSNEELLETISEAFPRA